MACNICGSKGKSKTIGKMSFCKTHNPVGKDCTVCGNPIRQSDVVKQAGFGMTRRNPISYCHGRCNPTYRTKTEAKKSKRYKGGKGQYRRLVKGGKAGKRKIVFLGGAKDKVHRSFKKTIKVGGHVYKLYFKQKFENSASSSQKGKWGERRTMAKRGGRLLKTIEKSGYGRALYRSASGLRKKRKRTTTKKKAKKTAKKKVSKKKGWRIKKVGRGNKWSTHKTKALAVKKGKSLKSKKGFYVNKVGTKKKTLMKAGKRGRKKKTGRKPKKKVTKAQKDKKTLKQKIAFAKKLYTKVDKRGDGSGNKKCIYCNYTTKIKIKGTSARSMKSKSTRAMNRHLNNKHGKKQGGAWSRMVKDANKGKKTAKSTKKTSKKRGKAMITPYEVEWHSDKQPVKKKRVTRRKKTAEKPAKKPAKKTGSKTEARARAMNEARREMETLWD